MAVATYTKTGSKASSAATLPKGVFGLKVENHELLKTAYNAYLDNARTNNATTKLRGEVRGGGKKPWKQKGTGRARAGSIRSPLWRGGGITFGPRGVENYSKKLPKTSRRTAIKQALSVSNEAGNVAVIEAFTVKDGKTKAAADLLKKLGAERRTLVVMAEKTDDALRSTNNLENVKLVGAKYVNVFDVMNADLIVIEKPALEIIEQWLTGGAK